MPLVRVEVRNEYGLGAPELYREANKEDPKALLEGVAVSGLVGILRQLGDLAEFAAEVFHGLQEQVTITSSRSHKLMGRVQRIEAALPPLEKLILAQRSHLHFAYTAGANWHTRLRRERSHFIYSDLPRFIMDSYEHCRGPPHMNLLDKFDPGGPGSCLKRYSDPSFFRRASSGSDEACVDKMLREKRGRKIKKKRSSQKTVEVSRGASFSNTSERMKLISPKMDRQTLPSQMFSLSSEPRSDLGKQSVSLGSRYWSVDVDHISQPSYSMNHGEQEYKESYSSLARMHHKESNSCVFIDEKDSVLDDMQSSLLEEQTGRTSFGMTWDGKSEILEPMAMNYDCSETTGTLSMNLDYGIAEDGAITPTSKEYHNCENQTPLMTFDVENEDKGTSHFRSSECDYDYNYTSDKLEMNFVPETQGRGSYHSTSLKGYEPQETRENHSTNFDLETENREVVHLETTGQMDNCLNNKNLSMPISSDVQLGCSEIVAVDPLSSLHKIENVHTLISGDPQHDEVESETDNYVDALNTIESEYETDLDGPAKQEGEQDSDSDYKVVDNRVDMVATMQSGSHPSNSKSLNSTSSSDNGAVLPETCLRERLEKFSDSDNKAVDGGVHMLTSMQPGSHPSSPKSLSISSSSPDNGAAVLPETCLGERLEQFTGSDNKAVDNGLHMLASLQSESHSSDSKSLNTSSSSPGSSSAPALPETCSGERVTSESLSNSLSSESCGFVQSSQTAGKCLDSGCMLDVASCENVNNLGSSNVNSVVSTISSVSAQKNFDVPISHKLTSTCVELQKISPEHSSVSSSVTPVKLWTNGGLLGLQPSKPPDFSMLNVSNESHLKSKDDKIGTSTLQPGITQKRSEIVEGAAVPNFSTSYQDDRKGAIFMKNASRLLSSADLGVNLQKLSDSYSQSNAELNDTSELYGIIHPVAPDIQSTKPSQGNSSNSSRMFDMGNRLLMNGFRRRPSLDKDDNFTSTSSPNADVSELKNSSQKVDNQILSGGSNEILRSRSPFVSPPSSPPLGHMKISFHPLNGYEAQLQLKYSDGNVSRESGGDTFPSFQLVPEPTLPLHNTGLDSEDDTFCRSSPYGSDCLSPKSDSNSEQWESDGSLSNKDNELHDSLGRFSFTESVSTSWDTGAVFTGDAINSNHGTQISFDRNNVEHSQSGHLFDLPSLDTLEASVMERNNPKEPTPSPPPLPPPQWRAMKQGEFAVDRQGVLSENQSNSFDQKFESTFSQQPKPVPFKQELITEAADMLESKKPDLQKASRQKEVIRAVSQKEIVEKDDFLLQIRTKSFNLRRTVMAKPTISTVPPTSVQITAILKKANEIRQAVGSDGEGDNWSDT